MANQKPPMTVPTPQVQPRQGDITDILNLPDKPWRPGDPVSLSNNQIWQVIAQKLSAEKQQLEATATELDLKVSLYRSAYEQASGVIADLRREIEILKVQALTDSADGLASAKAKVTQIRRKGATVEPQPDGFGN